MGATVRLVRQCEAGRHAMSFELLATECDDRSFLAEAHPTQPKTILSAIDYVHEKSVRRKLCERAVNWHWSSARSYLSGELDRDLSVIDALSLDLLDEGTT